MINEELEARVLVLPTGFDPDSFLLEHGAESFIELADKAKNIMSFLIDSAVSRHGLSIEGKLNIVSDMMEPLLIVRDNMARILYAKELAERIDIDETTIIEKIKAGAAKKKAFAHNQPAGDFTRRAEQNVPSASVSVLKEDRLGKANRCDDASISGNDSGSGKTGI